MDGREFFEKIVKPNYYEAKRNPEDFRLIWNAIVSMNTVPEFVALERLNYITGREAADKESAAIRNEYQSLLDLKECAEALKHVRKQKHSDSGNHYGLPGFHHIHEHLSFPALNMAG